jgi:HPr kinase/phosphorylase
MKELSLKEFYQQKKKDFSLSLITSAETLNDKVMVQYLNRPGLALAGYFERFSNNRIHILGETEISYLQSLDDEVLFERLKEFFVYDFPCIIVTKGLSVPSQMEFLANDKNIAILGSRITTEALYHSLKKYLDEVFAPSKTIHGTLVSVYGVGILLTGKSGIGKSECGLDLVERGHRLITDDVVRIELKNDELIGRANHGYGYFMEVRGVGIIDVERMFGIQAVRDSKRIDIQVELKPWKDNMNYERIGIGNNYIEILGIKNPIIYLPISPGKNVSVILEVIAMNHILKTYGYDAGKVMSKRLQEEINKKAMLRKEFFDESKKK